MWTYKNKEITCIEDMPDDAVGFVYEIINKENDFRYIGKKVIKTIRTSPPLKGKKRKRKSIRESDWKTYYGSNEVIKNLIKEGKKDIFERNILQYAFSKSELTYLEAKYQFMLEVLEKDNYLNQNILGKFYKGRI
jgi:hypothetical protein